MVTHALLCLEKRWRRRKRTEEGAGRRSIAPGPHAFPPASLSDEGVRDSPRCRVHLHSFSCITFLSPSLSFVFAFHFRTPPFPCNTMHSCTGGLPRCLGFPISMLQLLDASCYSYGRVFLSSCCPLVPWRINSIAWRTSQCARTAERTACIPSEVESAVLYIPRSTSCLPSHDRVACPSMSSVTWV